MNTIINIRGTYGAGKTTLVRFVMDAYINKQAHYMPGRKQPIYYTLDHPNGGNQLAVVGSYETVCGGCDTIPETKLIFETVEYLSNEGYDVLYESVIITGNVGYTVDNCTKNAWNLQVIYLDTPVQVCIDSVNQRRQAKYPGKVDIDPKNLLSKYASCKSSQRTLNTHGVPTYLLSRADAFIKTMELLGVESVL